jgi:hypothetical protein
VMIAVDPVVSYPPMIACIDRFLMCLPGFNSLFGLAELNTVSRNLSILVLELDRDMLCAVFAYGNCILFL